MEIISLMHESSVLKQMTRASTKGVIRCDLVLLDEKL